MKVFLRLIWLFLIIIGIGIFARYVWARYGLGQKDVSLNKTVVQTTQDLKNLGAKLDEKFQKVLGERTSNKPLESYLEEELQRNEVFKEIQREITTVINETTEKIKKLPQNQAEKLKREIKEEICREVLK